MLLKILQHSGRPPPQTEHNPAVLTDPKGLAPVPPAGREVPWTIVGIPEGLGEREITEEEGLRKPGRIHESR